MRENLKPCHHTVSEDIVYKEVVVIGNGPSGMITSFMLAGNVPYLKSIPDDLFLDEMLKTRLSNLPPGQSLYEADLMQLAEGLEGRSLNPISLLMDALVRPGADLGIHAEPLIEWRYHVEKQIEHIVLGREPPGGAWHTFPPDVKTISPTNWLVLPPDEASKTDRVTARTVADYCVQYVKKYQLQRYFRSDIIVTSVVPADPPGEGCDSTMCPLNARWIVSGYDKKASRRFSYACDRVVLACGATDKPNTLPTHIAEHAAHSLADVEMAVEALMERPICDRVVSVVGSGVSAADAICLASSRGLSVAHVHRDPAPALAALAPSLYPEYYKVYKMMCEGVPVGDKYTPYPEHVVVEISPQTDKQTDTKIEKLIRPKQIKLLNVVTNEIVEIKTSLLTVLIGSKPDLFFLNKININKCEKCSMKIEEKRQCFLRYHWHYLKSVMQSCKSKYLNTDLNGNDDADCILADCKKSVDCKCKEYASVGIGVDANKPVDSRSNPVAIYKSSHELVNLGGVYALGPLTADNFIRFIPGGALALVAHIHKEKKLGNNG